MNLFFSISADLPPNPHKNLFRINFNDLRLRMQSLSAEDKDTIQQYINNIPNPPNNNNEILFLALNSLANKNYLEAVAYFTDVRANAPANSVGSGMAFINLVQIYKDGRIENSDEKLEDLGYPNYSTEMKYPYYPQIDHLDEDNILMLPQ